MLIAAAIIIGALLLRKRRSRHDVSSVAGPQHEMNDRRGQDVAELGTYGNKGNVNGAVPHTRPEFKQELQSHDAPYERDFDQRKGEFGRHDQFSELDS